MVKKALINFSLYTICFAVFFLQKKGFEFSGYYLEYFAFYIGAWALASLLSRKFRKRERREFLPNLYPYLISFFLMLGLFAGFSMFFKLYDVSYLILLWSLLSSVAIEVGFVLYTNGFELGIGKQRKLIISYRVMIVDLVILVWVMAFALSYQMKEGLYFDEKLILFLISVLTAWLVAAIMSHQFPPYSPQNDFWRYIWGYLKAYTIFMALLSFSMLLLRLPVQENYHLFGGGVLYTFWSFIVVVFSYVDQKQKQTDEVNVSLLRSSTFIDYEGSVFEVAPSVKYSLPVSEGTNGLLIEKLSGIYLKNDNELFTFLENNLDLRSFNLTKTVILRSSDTYNLEVLPQNHLHLFFNLHEINDLRRVNAYFIEVNKRLINGGVFIGRLEPIRLRYLRFLKSYPFYLGHIFYFIDFIWRRVIPKLPGLKHFYFLITKGKNRAIPLAEGLGRLYFCGFEMIGSTEIDGYVYFVAKKSFAHRTDTDPSYGPLFKMKRMGKGGKPIFVYKLRTMHPYSEYLQKYMYERNSLKDGGKIKDDFRISNWGKVFRKLWIDELPMLINWFKGDLKLVGVRPLSSHYLSLYSDELKALRKKVKPGLVPPFYADMPKTLEEIMNSELTYLNAYINHPWTTDARYFFRSFYNILIKKARSS